MNPRIDLIFTFFPNDMEQLWFETDLDPKAIESEEKLKTFVTATLTEHEKENLCKVSCCVSGIETDAPEWYLKANGKLWFNDDKREEYGLN